MYISRHLEKVVEKMSETFPVVLVTGPRQVGKTTMLEKVSGPDWTYVTLDHPIQRELAKSEPELFLQRYQPPVIIDEIQYAPNLLPYIKIEVDKNKRMGDYWLTGSQMFHLMQNVSESLAGRVGIINMLGLSQAEIIGDDRGPYGTTREILQPRLKTRKAQDMKQIFQRIFQGSMPALYQRDQDTELYYASYVNTYLERDVRDLAQVGDELAFLRFLTACAGRSSQMLNYSDLARDVGISSGTAQRWLSILVSTGIIALVEPYYNNRLQRVIKSPNMYFLDTGLCAYLSRWTSPESLEAGAMSGAFFETYVVSEIIKSFYNSGRKPPIYYYRDKDQKEIDLIIEQDDTLYPIEIKKSANPSRDAIANFKVLEKTKQKVGQGNVICLANDYLPIDGNNDMVPVWLI